MIGLDAFFEGPNPKMLEDACGDENLMAAIKDKSNIVLVFKTLQEGDKYNYLQDATRRLLMIQQTN